jgi:hypothetical protein
MTRPVLFEQVTYQLVPFHYFILISRWLCIDLGKLSSHNDLSEPIAHRDWRREQQISPIVGSHQNAQRGCLHLAFRWGCLQNDFKASSSYHLNLKVEKQLPAIASRMTRVFDWGLGCLIIINSQFQCYENSQSMVRRASIICLVSISNAIGLDTLKAHISPSTVYDYLKHLPTILLLVETCGSLCCPDDKEGPLLTTFSLVLLKKTRIQTSIWECTIFPIKSE